MINEVAWRGSRASSADEWIELLNATDQPIDLDGWLLTDGNDLGVLLQGSLSPHAYFLLERDDDQSVADVAADVIYSGSLSDDGETLQLLDAYGIVVDSANAIGPGAPQALLSRAARSPAQFAWLQQQELIGCKP